MKKVLGIALLLAMLLSAALIFSGCQTTPQQAAPAAQGPAGPAGPQGDQGVAGQQGQTGDTGQMGDAGHKGDRGHPGEQGYTGNTGEKGETGDRGKAAPCPAGQHAIRTPITEEWIACTTMQHQAHDGERGGSVNSNATSLMDAGKCPPFFSRGRNTVRGTCEKIGRRHGLARISTDRPSLFILR